MHVCDSNVCLADTRFERAARNGCSGCGQDFTSVELFDRHHVGSFEPLERRCLTIEEMRSKGWQQDVRGRWMDPARAERARRTFAEAA
jgi:hypothetical protein